MKVFFKEKIKPTDKQLIQKSAGLLANLCLLNEDFAKNYTDEDLMNATLILIHFLGDIIYSTNKNLSFETRCELVKINGEAIRGIIEGATGKDMHEIAKK
jgi:hypothetical protein